MISVEHMQELIDKFDSGELDIRDIIEQSYFGGRADAIEEFADTMQLVKRSRRMSDLVIKPISYKSASDYVNAHHRHHKAPQGNKFSIGCYVEDNLVGVAICGRPVGRFLDDGLTCEITRVCTDGTKNACSKLYGACCRIAKEMGYTKIITYILESEDGASVKASNFICEGKAGGTHWTGCRDKGQDIPHEMKTRWSRQLKEQKE